MTVSLRLALACVIASAVTGCGAAPDTEGRLKELEAKLEAQSLLLDNLTCQLSQTEGDMLITYCRVLELDIVSQDRWNHVSPPGLEYTVRPIAEYAINYQQLMADQRDAIEERHAYRKIDEIRARRQWPPRKPEKLPPPYSPMTNRNAEK